jgi:DNA-binding FadR family transcriptional regulator
MAKGLVDTRPKVGTRINARAKWHLMDADVLEWMFESGPDVAVLNNLFELRNVIESAAAGLAATRRSIAHLRTMRASLDVLAIHTLCTHEGRQADLLFHLTLLHATENPYIISLSTGVSAAISAMNIFERHTRPLSRDPLSDYVRVFAAIEVNDAAKAQKAMSQLIQTARTEIPVSRRSNGRRA